MPYVKLEDLNKVLPLTEEEKGWKPEGPSLPVLISDHLFSLIDRNDEKDPIRRQFVPSEKENIDVHGDLDPLREVDNTKSVRLIHRYHNRAALLTTDRCFSYCRHCFRRRFTAKESGPISTEELREAASYLREHREIREVLLTGGDMFTLSDDKLDEMLGILKEAREDIIYRLCTRAVVAYPERFTENLFSIIKKHQHGAPFFLMTQINHPREITPETTAVVDRFISLGIIPFNQSVLLKGVNDDADVLEELSDRLLMARIKPYYLFQGDLVNGTSHLRVNVSDGLKLEKELRKRVSGLGMPQYTMDLPDGGGKVILTENYVVGLEGDTWTVRSPYSDEIRKYPEIKD